MKKIMVVLALAIASVCRLSAEDEEFGRGWQCWLYGGVSATGASAWTLEPSVKRMFNKYVGVGLGLEVTSQFGQTGHSTMIDGHIAELAANERDVRWILFKPAVVIRTPDIWRSADGAWRLWLQGEPGVTLGCPFRNSLTYEILDFQGNVSTVTGWRRFSNHGLRWAYWNARVSVNIAFDYLVFGASYSVSNLDYYSGRRGVTLADGTALYVPARELFQSVSVSVGYLF